MIVKHSKKWYFWAKIIAKVAGFFFAFVPAFLAAIIMFPTIVVKETASTVSGVMTMASMFAIVPLVAVFIKNIKTPSASLVTTFLLIVVSAVFTAVYYAENSTRFGLMVVSITAAVSNVISTVLFKLSSVWDDLFKHCGEIYINPNS